MKPSQPVRSPVRALGAALFDTGLRVREECDELILNRSEFELRVSAVERSSGYMVRCVISIAEYRLMAGYGEIFNAMALEGYPVVAFGAGHGQVSFEFSWFHPEGADWRISGQHCQGLIDRVLGELAPIPQRAAGKSALRQNRLAPLPAIRSGGLAPAGSRG